jgi:uncharacterized protein
MIIVSNSSPLIALSSFDRLDILAQLFTTVYIPDAVYQETVTANPMKEQRTRIERATHTFLQIRHPTIHRLFTRNLGDGEQGVLNLALEIRPDFILLDDKKARNEAKDCGLEFLLTTEVLTMAEHHQYIQSYHQCITQLAVQKIYLPE